MSNKISVEFNEREIKLLKDLAEQKGLSLEALIKQSARFYQSLEVRLAQKQITWEQVQKLLKDDFPSGCGPLD